jgi:nucleoside-diphosphate-sugar epimerase
MRVFLTSASGHVGSAVASAFLQAGHAVAALTRSPEKAAALSSRGLQPVIGDLRTHSTYVDVAAEHDVVVHTAFEYDANGREMRSTDVAAVEGLLSSAHGSAVQQFIYTSSAFLLAGLADVIDEHTPTEAAHLDGAWRLQLERRVLDTAGEHLRTAVVRLGVVYGANSFTMNELFSAARRDGSVPYHGTGQDRWPLVYRGDLAALYVRVAEQRARGIFHGVDGQPLTVARVAELASRAAGCEGRTRSIPAENARDEGDEHAERVTRDVPVVTRASLALGWRPGIASFEAGAALAYREWCQAHAQDP